MARAQGAGADGACVRDRLWPAARQRLLPHAFASTSLGAEQPLQNSELLGYGRDPRAPIKDAATAHGDVAVPLEAEAIGFWLKAAFGPPTTTGTGPWTQELQSRPHPHSPFGRASRRRRRECGRAPGEAAGLLHPGNARPASQRRQSLRIRLFWLME